MLLINNSYNLNFGGITRLSSIKKGGDKFINRIGDMIDPEKSPAESKDFFDVIGQNTLRTRIDETLLDINVLKYEAQRAQETSKGAYERAKFTIDDIKNFVINHNRYDSFYDENTDHDVVIDGKIIREYNQKGEMARKTTLSSDRKTIEKIEEKAGDKIDKIERTENGIKIIKGLNIYPNGAATAKRLFYFDDKGNLTNCVKNFKSKEDEYGETSYRSYEKNFEFENGKLRRIAIGTKITPNKTSIRQNIKFSRSGAIESIYKRATHKNGEITYTDRSIFEEEDSRIEGTINNYEPVYRLIKDSTDRGTYKTNILINQNGELI